MQISIIKANGLLAIGLRLWVWSRTGFKVVPVADTRGDTFSSSGTICQKIAETYNLVHLSAGELLRKEMADPLSHFAAEIEPYIKAGTIVPVEITCSLLHKAMLEGFKSKQCVTYLIDGFPRNEDNKSGWERNMCDKTRVLQVLVLDCPEDVCVKRCLGRGCGRIDDNEETLKNRITQFKVEGLPVIEYYGQKGLVTHIDGSKTPQEVFREVQRVLDPILLNSS
ncbi:cytidine monophosphate (UMP-CMP) kinase 1, cytosolic [Sparganum proliferum]